MLATACDARVMVKENARIGLNGIGFGSSLFAGSLELLRFWVGERRAQELVYAGALHGPEQALSLGLVDASVAGVDLMDEARKRLDELVVKSPAPSAASSGSCASRCWRRCSAERKRPSRSSSRSGTRTRPERSWRRSRSAPDASADAQSVSQNACRRSLKAGASSQNTA